MTDDVLRLADAKESNQPVICSEKSCNVHVGFEEKLAQHPSEMNRVPTLCRFSSEEVSEG